MTSSGHTGADSISNRRLLQLSNLTILKGPSSVRFFEILQSRPGNRGQNPDRTSVRQKCLRG